MQVCVCVCVCRGGGVDVEGLREPLEYQVSDFELSPLHLKVISIFLLGGGLMLGAWREPLEYQISDFELSPYIWK